MAKAIFLPKLFSLNLQQKENRKQLRLLHSFTPLIHYSYSFSLFVLVVVFLFLFFFYCCFVLFFWGFFWFFFFGAGGVFDHKVA